MNVNQLKVQLRAKMMERLKSVQLDDLQQQTQRMSARFLKSKEYTNSKYAQC